MKHKRKTNKSSNKSLGEVSNENIGFWGALGSMVFPYFVAPIIAIMNWEDNPKKAKQAAAIGAVSILGGVVWWQLKGKQIVASMKEQEHKYKAKVLQGAYIHQRAYFAGMGSDGTYDGTVLEIGTILEYDETQIVSGPLGANCAVIKNHFNKGGGVYTDGFVDMRYLQAL